MRLRKDINKPIVFCLMIMIAISLAFFILGFIYYKFPKLSSFNIIGIQTQKDSLILNVSKCYNAKSYNVEVKDEKNNVIYEKKSSSNKIDISDLMMNYEQTVSINVYTKSKKNEIKNSNNVYKYKNLDASFNKEKNYFANDFKDITLNILGAKSDEEYYVKLYYRGSNIGNYDVSNDTVVLNYDSIKNYSGRVTAKLYNKDDRAISLFNFYLNTPIIGNFKILSPSDNFVMNWDDLDIYFEGGNNATTMQINIYDKKDKIVSSKKLSFPKEHIILDASEFKENNDYKVEFKALYDDYDEIGKTAILNISVLDKQTVKPVYVDKNPNNIKAGSSISLLTNTENATIYYTLDGSKPTINSNVYNDKITINENTTIKTYAVKKNMNDSDINTYEFKISDKQLVVYLSPSNQFGNKGVSSVGYTNERDMMNKVADYLYEDLINAGVKVYRNNPSGNINLWLAESNNHKSDLHLALHSNASSNHDIQGMEIYVDKSTSKALSIASNIYNNLYEIYPYREKITDRGVKYSDGSLGEANDSFIKCGTLIEVAYHDNSLDAKWIVDNSKEIANNIAKSILDFYQVN